MKLGELPLALINQLKAMGKIKVVLAFFTFLALYSCSTQKVVLVQNSLPIEKVEITESNPITPNYTVEEVKKEIHLVTLKPKDTLKENYENAFQELQNMLEGDQHLSFKRAVYVVENTWHKNDISYPVFDAEIKRLASFGKAWMKANSKLNYQKSDSLNLLKNLAIYRVLKDTLYYIKDTSGNKYIGHLPFTYDFTDFFGKENWSQMFVSKLVATGSGNCHSMPYLYNILAEELEAKSWLSFAPNHVYIKNYSQKDGWYNTELTSGGFPSDAWLSASGYISLDAIRNGIFMDTLSKKQNIGLCLYDLAKGYENQTKNYSNGFILKCVDLVLKYHPNNINALILKAEALRYSQANAPPSAELNTLCMQILKLGYREMPERMYLSWLTSSDEKPADTMELYAQNPFASIGKEAKVLTLSKGKFDEAPNTDNIQHIGGIIINQQAGKVIGFLPTDKGYIIQEPTVIGRHWSIDPLANHPNQIGMSPYSSFWNNPIRYDDPDGNCPTCPLAAAGGVLGGLIGGGIEAGMQLYKSGKITDWGAVRGSAVQGLITGTAAGFTGGASLLITATTAAGANAAGGYVSRKMQGKATTAKDVAIDAAIGIGGVGAAKVVGNVVKSAAAKWAAAKVGESASKTASNHYDDLVAAAQKQYPKLAGKTQKHHPIPTYIGGDKNQALVPLDAAYHQLITNEFRKLWPYGKGPIKDLTQRQAIVEQVYKKYPLPK
jgi:hypothetical protein